MRRSLRRISLPILSLALALAGSGRAARAADWPQFRGPLRDGVSTEKGLLRSWPATGPKVLWKRPIGEGYSGVSIAGGRLYTMDSDDKTEFALCLDPATGKEIWRTAVGPKFLDELGNGPRATPTVDDDSVFVLGAKGALVALKAADGAKVWTVELTALGGKVPTWAYSSSPLVDGGLVVLEVGGPGKSLVAFDRATGAVKWAVGDGDAAYSSPVIMTIGGVKQYVINQRAGSKIVSLSTAGEILWSHTGPPSNITMPLFIPPDRVYLSSGDDAGALLLRIKSEGGKWSVEELWKNRVMKNHFHGSVLVGEHLYGFDNGTFKCISVATGEQTWAQRGLGKGSVLLADGLLIVQSDRGDVVLAEANPAAYVEKSRFQALEGKSWTAPTLSGGRLYVRDQDEIACLDLQAHSQGAAR